MRKERAQRTEHFPPGDPRRRQSDGFPTGGDLSGPVTVTDEGDILMVDRAAELSRLRRLQCPRRRRTPDINSWIDSPLVAAFANNGAFVTGGRGDSLLDVWPMRRGCKPANQGQRPTLRPKTGHRSADSRSATVGTWSRVAQMAESTSRVSINAGGAGQPRILEGSGRVSFVRFIGEGPTTICGRQCH